MYSESSRTLTMISSYLCLRTRIIKRVGRRGSRYAQIVAALATIRGSRHGAWLALNFHHAASQLDGRYGYRNQVCLLASRASLGVSDFGQGSILGSLRCRHLVFAERQSDSDGLARAGNNYAEARRRFDCMDANGMAPPFHGRRPS